MNGLKTMYCTNSKYKCVCLECYKYEREKSLFCEHGFTNRGVTEE